ncbi:hypothetical protein DSECCO2_620800 [anaerobic digester metagenome]
MNFMVVWSEVGFQRFERHGCGNFGLFQKTVGIIEKNGAHGGKHIRAIDGGQTVAGHQSGNRNTGAFQRFFSFEEFTFVIGMAFAHHEQRNLRHRCKIAAGAHRALFANHRRYSFVEHVNQRLGNFEAAARIAMSMNIDAAHHGSAHPFNGHRIADSGSVVIHKKFLEFLDLFFVEHHFRKFADSGVDAVHDFAGFDFLFHHGAASIDAFNSIGMQFNFFAEARYLNQLFNGQTLTVYYDCHFVVGFFGF